MTFLAAVSFRFDSPVPLGETVDGFRLDFRIQGTIEGPALKGTFPPFGAYLLIDPSGVGTINVRVPMVLDDGAIAELEAVGRYGDFGRDGYRTAIAGHLPDSELGWCPRFFTADPRYTWLNRILPLAVGWLRPGERRVDYDLFAVSQIGASLYDRIGGRPVIDKLAGDFVGALNDPNLNRQNPRIAAARVRTNPDEMTKKIAEFFSQVAGGPREYAGLSMKTVHSPLNITEADWAIVAGYVYRSLTKHGIPQAEQSEFIAGLEETKSAVVKR